MAKRKNIPAVSIIIPMYNTAKYIGECLDSILAQSFDDYEVIVVDDCSTDDSCALVENYIPKFNTKTDKLQLIKTDVNSGGGGTPRNMGIRYAYGEYIMFLDSDDAITKDAIKDFYTVATDFDADVVHCEKFFAPRDESITTDIENLDVVAIKKANFVENPTLMSDNLEERIQIFNSNQFDWSTYTNFIRRDLIIRHNLQFPDFKVCEDAVFTLYLLCLAQKFVLTPSVHYIYRFRQDSACRSNLLGAGEIINRWGDFFFRGITLLDKFFDKFQLFREYPEYKYGIYDLLMSSNNGPTLNSYSNATLTDIENFARAELAKVDDKTALAAFMFNRMNIMNLRYINLQNSIRQIKEIAKQL